MLFWSGRCDFDVSDKGIEAVSFRLTYIFVGKMKNKLVMILTHHLKSLMKRMQMASIFIMSDYDFQTSLFIFQSKKGKKMG